MCLKILITAWSVSYSLSLCGLTLLGTSNSSEHLSVAIFSSPTACGWESFSAGGDSRQWAKLGQKHYEYFLNHIKQTERRESMKRSKGYRSDRDKPDGVGKCKETGGCWAEVLLAPDSWWKLSPGFSRLAKPTAGEPAVLSPCEQRQCPGSGCSYRKRKLNCGAEQGCAGVLPHQHLGALHSWNHCSCCTTSAQLSKARTTGHCQQVFKHQEWFWAAACRRALQLPLPWSSPVRTLHGKGKAVLWIFHQLIGFTASELYSLILDHLDFYLLKEAWLS